jgi:hypothetical protein
MSKQEAAKAGKQLSEAEMKRLKATLFKPVVTNPVNKKEQPAATPAQNNNGEDKKKKLFGLF